MYMVSYNVHFVKQLPAVQKVRTYVHTYVALETSSTFLEMMSA